MREHDTREHDDRRPQNRLPEGGEVPAGWHLERCEPEYAGQEGNPYLRRDDGAYVFKRVDIHDQARPWLEGHRPWMAFAPPEQWPPADSLGLDPKYDGRVPVAYRPTRRNRYGRRIESPLKVQRLFKTALAAMRMLDEEYPRQEFPQRAGGSE